MPSNNEDDASRASLRSPLAALAGALEAQAEDEPKKLLRAHKMREARAARKAAAKHPIPQK